MRYEPGICPLFFEHSDGKIGRVKHESIVETVAEFYMADDFDATPDCFKEYM